MASVRICLQWTLIIFNTFSIILGVLGVLASVYELQKCLNDSAEWHEKIGNIAIGSALVISGIIGCCGAVNGSIKTLTTFLCALLLLMGAHGWIFWRHDADHQSALVEKMVNGIWLTEMVRRGAMSEIQQSYKCCGKTGFTDYTSLELKIPSSCYHPKTALHTPFSEGCMSTIKRSYLQFYRYELYAHFGLVAFEVLGVILTFALIWKLTAKSRRYRYY